jgi:UDP-glucose:(heptosyl)LPS alpha-1,3-glucosyltransferase
MGQLPGATLVVAGRGDSRGIDGGRVRFLGAVADVASLHAAADVFVLPTIYDPSSNACLEALAAGLPVITTDANGFAEVMTENVHGSTVRVGDVDGIARALFYWSDAGRRAAARVACRALGAEYSVARNVEETLKILNAV